MAMKLRFTALMLGAAVLFAAGCDKSSSTGTGAGSGGQGGTKSKLVGTWEGSDDDMKGKDGKPATVTVEFKADGSITVAMGPIDMKGTWKMTKEEGKTMTIDTEMTMPGFEDPKAPSKPKHTVFTITFEDANTIEMTPTDKKDPKKLKRKS